MTDNLLSNIEKYADPAARLTILAEREGERLHVCFANRARRELARVESNHIGLRTCAAILKLLGGEFVTHRDGEAFTAEFTLPVTPPGRGAERDLKPTTGCGESLRSPGFFLRRGLKTAGMP